jgi:hypothetical protein
VNSAVRHKQPGWSWWKKWPLVTTTPKRSNAGGKPFWRGATEVLQTGFDERFIHIWEFYLAYCEAAFDESNIDVVQYTLRKPGV